MAKVVIEIIDTEEEGNQGVTINTELDIPDQADYPKKDLTISQIAGMIIKSKQLEILTLAIHQKEHIENCDSCKKETIKQIDDTENNAESQFTVH